MSNQLVDITELSQQLSISKSWLYQKVAQRGIPFIKIGRAVRFDVEEIKKWLEKQKHGVELHGTN